MTKSVYQAVRGLFRAVAPDSAAGELVLQPSWAGLARHGLGFVGMLRGGLNCVKEAEGFFSSTQELLDR